MVVTLLSLGIAPTAQAVSPPPIDPSRLPEPAPPAPPEPTAQREVCATLAADPDRGTAGGQLAGLGLPQAWQLTRGSGQRIAIIDTGVSPHRRLPHLVAGGDYVFTGDGTRDCDGHGTVVAGIAAAVPDSNSDGFSGVAPEATVISIRQSSTKFGPLSNRSSTGVGDVDTMAKAVRTAADLGASVINISSVACVAATSVLDDRALGAALAYAVDVKNVVVVAAAGNTGGTGQCPSQRPPATWDELTVAVSPAWYDDYVLSVGSVNAAGAPSSFTLAGPWVDVAAPGEAVTSLSPTGEGIVNAAQGPGGSTVLSGTSYAAPVVAGLAALIRSRFPVLTARQVMQRIQTTAHHPPGGWDPLIGNGIIDPLAAVSTDSRPPDAGPETGNTPAVITPPPPPRPPDRRARTTALTGAAACLALLVVVLAVTTAAGRLRRPGMSPDRRGRDGVPGG
ncbi:type VII secretion-associated serine protease mycosin [Mycobacterium sp. SM1]|uniref:type VII secretion-associated serine protease mycosin n=1 Tax=Mycobacterium sp. SM1 TaxID=2816243 RepID=UPI001BCCB4B2|nr:type VII secretion-associated serine protease mycosin [Mycobacterium sp. SM1]MBS4728892.1 type VII secretion-associated serine protease mycosin [Mycobacterium sp. SM1]